MSLGRRRSLLVLAVVAVAVAAMAVAVLLTREDERGSLEAALRYLPADAPLAIAVETDLSDQQWDGFARTLGRPFVGERSILPLPSPLGGGRLEDSVTAWLAQEGIDYRREIKPLLGGELVVGTTSVQEGVGDPPFVVALEVGDAGVADRALREQLEVAPVGEYRGASLYGYGDEGGEAEYALDDQVLLVAEGSVGEGGGRNLSLRQAIDRARDGDHLTVEAFEDSLPGGGDPLLRLYADPRPFLELPDAAPLRRLPWVAALRGVGATASFEGREIVVEAIARTDPSGLSPGELPLAAESGEPELVLRDGETSSGTLDQSVTTAFLVRAARLIFADSRFIRDVERIERDLGIDFEREVLRQFSGPSASVVAPDGSFAARSTVADPAAMRELLPRLAPRLPQLVRDLDSLGRPGLLALLLVAPDAPVAPAPSGAISIAQADPGGDQEEGASPAEEEDLYVLRGPRAPEGVRPVVPLPDRIVFGMIGDVFVVASDRRRAREMASAAAEPVDGLSGSSVLYAPQVTRGQVANVLGFPIGPAESARLRLEADLESLRARFVVSYE